MTAAPTRSRRLAAVATTVSGLLAGTVVAPRRLGLGGRYGWAQLVALRGAVGAAAAGLGTLGLLTARDAGQRRPSAWASVAGGSVRTSARAHTMRGVSAVCLLTAGAEAAVLLARGVRCDPLPAPDGTGASLTVVVANTLHSRAAPAALLALLTRVGADVVALPEAGGEFAAGLVAEMAAPGGDGAKFQRFTSPRDGEVAPTTLLIADRLGLYRRVQQPSGGPGSVVVAPVAGHGPLVAAVHPYPPRTRATTGVWRQRAREAVQVGRAVPDAVVAGDLNATLDHPVLQRLAPLTDAAAQRRAGAVGTWPAGLPWLLGTPIDHVLVTAARWRVIGYSVTALAGSDHRAVVVRLVRR